MKIPVYEYQISDLGFVALTLCPHDMGYGAPRTIGMYIGSLGCVKCKHYKGDGPRRYSIKCVYVPRRLLRPEKIKYEGVSLFSSTPCPYGIELLNVKARVSNVDCILCPHFGGADRVNNIVECNFKSNKERKKYENFHDV